MRRLLVLLLVLGSACSGAKPAAGGCHPARLLSLGDRIPSCSFRSFDGSTFALASLQGRPAVINFWASWCTECLHEMPAFERVHKQLLNQVTIVGANQLGVAGEVSSAARAYAKARGVTYPLFFDRDGLLYSNFARRKALLPMSLFVRGDGVVAYMKFGALDESELRSLVRSKLGV